MKNYLLKILTQCVDGLFKIIKQKKEGCLILRDCGDILDRFVISQLKWERININDQEKEYQIFKEAWGEIVKEYKIIDWNSFLKIMKNIHSTIWFLEAALKSGKERLPNPHYLRDPQNKEILAEIGIDSILIRNINSIRIDIKNIISGLTKTGFKETKSHHLSE